MLNRTAVSQAAYDRAIFLLLDGARADVFQDLLDEGDLPNVSRYLVEPGGFRAATTVFPSVTGVAYAPYITGCFPQKTNLTGVRWFDREIYARRKVSVNRFRNYVGFGHFMMDRDLSRQVTTLFEILKPSSNIFGTISRGTGVHRNAFLFRRIPWTFQFLMTGDWAPIDERANALLLRAALRKKERFTFHVTLQVDEHSHADGPFSPRARAGYRAFDRAVGELCARLRGAGRLDRTLIMMGADHGHSEVHNHFDLEAFFEERRQKVLYPTRVLKNWFDCDAAVMVGGNGMGHIYLRGGGWTEDETGDERLARMPGVIDDLLAEEAVDVVAWQPGDDGSVKVRSRRGTAVIRLTADQVTYVVDGTDPFGFPALPKLMSRREALRVTHGTEYPDGIVQIAQIFGSPRAGDLIVTARPGWDLRVRGEHHLHRSGHGSLHREHMLVPFASNHPIAQDVARSVDAYPTILKLLGESTPPGIDGESLVN
jgi:hypothetical protein